MDKEQYLSEVEKRLLRYFSASHEGYKAPAEDRHRLEGFMQGAAFMGFASSKELAELMEQAHFAVFGKSIEERRMENVSIWQDSVVNYDRYDQPAYVRGKVE
jgi:hypothetical protein